ncbi:adhesin [Dactylosporangium matsuzakiense]|uniref:Uncharacterized protein n=1 Tax=Dactylosporangium matsuzakiense TaxID=53360 RepID=A0A9W6KC36_9ACTN|nr:adhesin [Dactylosporangium matsuzakiense]UWZ47014.1 adhesin [Dactylosporangium matsuzakiense]GLK98562.1 hypothetical protein GCM10017581_003030 [Dactylosporangium matsuzakiense]
MTTTDQWGAAGAPDEDIAYRTQSLKFRGIELALDESVSAQAIVRLWLYAAAASITVFMVFFVLALFALIGGGASGSTAGFAGFGIMLPLGGLAGFVAFWLVLLLAKFQEPVAEWKTLIEGKAAAAESSYAAIYHSLARRRIPVGVTARRIRSDLLNESVNNRLIVTERTYVAYVSVFAFGTSLYVGWMMWRNRRGASLIAQFVKDLVGSMLGRTGIINQMLRTERVRAMREAVHSAVREGVDAAVDGIQMPIAATFGYEIPIESGATAPAIPAYATNRPQHGLS